MKTNRHILTTLILLSSFVLSLRAQPSEKKIKILPLPILGYEPETNFYLGAVTLLDLDLYSDSLTRSSNASLEFTYTWRKQLILEAEWDYFFPQEHWYTRGLVHYSYYPDFYFGLGPNSDESARLLFNSRRLSLEGNLYRRMTGRLFVGGGFRYIKYSDVESSETNPYTELKDASAFGITGEVFHDSRNSLLKPTEGAYYSLKTEYNFSSCPYTRMKLDLRKYFSFSEQYTLALRLYNSFNFNTPTFFDYSVMGGGRYVRGYYYGRFRDRHLTTLQGEIRIPLFWRIGVAATGGISSVYPNPGALFEKLWPSYGGGLRFVVDKTDRTSLRFDFVLGSQGHHGFYIGFGEAF